MSKRSYPLDIVFKLSQDAGGYAFPPSGLPSIFLPFVPKKVTVKQFSVAATANDEENAIHIRCPELVQNSIYQFLASITVSSVSVDSGDAIFQKCYNTVYPNQTFDVNPSLVQHLTTGSLVFRFFDSDNAALTLQSGTTIILKLEFHE